MAFLDNSGDIILDAVLTDLGRKRLAEGNFRITQFALGDDEIDYGLYDKNHPSGSAYYDLEILQTPVFEAFTQANANINYGLISLNGNTNILYMPTIVLNDKDVLNNNVLYSGVTYVATNASDVDTIKATVGTNSVLASGDTNRYFMFETGLNSTDGQPERTEANRTSYLVTTGLLDSEFMISFDGRFFEGVHPNSLVTFEYPQGSGDRGPNLQARVDIAADAVGGSTSTTGLENFIDVTVLGFDNLVYKQDNDDDLQVSSINGPRARVVAFSLATNPDMSGASAYYSLYGKTAENVLGDGNSYDYLDTMIYIRGLTTGVTTQLPVRIIRKV